MKQVAYIIGHMSSDPFRIRNLLLTLKWLLMVKKSLQPYLIKLKIIVVEQDTKPTICNIIDNNYVNYMFIYNPGQYNRGLSFNAGFVKFHECDYFFFADNDIVMSVCDMCKVIRTCFKYDAVNPYLNIYDTRSCLFETCDNIKFDIKCLFKDNKIIKKRDNVCFTGGIMGISRCAMYTISGWDERFRGRGWEDYAFTCKIKLFCNNICIYPYDAMHLWHPWDNCADKCANEELNCEYSQYCVDDYAKQCELSRGKIGCINKYICEEGIKKYHSDEENVNVKYQECRHCDEEIHIKCKSDYRCGYNVYYNLQNVIKSKHPNLSDCELHKYIYYNMCDQYDCKNSCKHDTCDYCKCSGSIPNKCDLCKYGACDKCNKCEANPCECKCKCHNLSS